MHAERQTARHAGNQTRRDADMCAAEWARRQNRQIGRHRGAHPTEQTDVQTAKKLDPIRKQSDPR